MKICTTIEQSKKLIELGIDVDSADMMWIIDGTSMPYVAVTDINVYLHDTPAWSLSALLELIPSYLGDYKDGIDFGLGRSMNGKWYSAHYLQTFHNGDIKSVKTVTGESAVDAAFEMVCWLKENGKI